MEIESFVSNWNRIHKQTARVLQAAPADKLEWRPADGMFTLRQLITHIARLAPRLALQLVWRLAQALVRLGI